MAGVSSTNSLIGFSGQSPYEPLQEHMRIVIECARQLPTLFVILRTGDRDKLGETRDTIFKLENAANGVKNKIRSDPPHKLFMQLDRGDLLEILAIQDRIADTILDIASMLTLRELRLPAPLHVALMGLVHRCVDACDKIGNIIEQLDMLLVSNIWGLETEKIAGMIDELGKIGTDTDHMAYELLRELFAREKEIGPVDVIIWLRIINWVGELADNAERVGNRHRVLIAQ